MCKDCPTDPITTLQNRLNLLEKAPTIKVKRIHPDAVMPKYATDGAAGLDVCCLEDLHIMADEKKLIKLGLEMEIPPGWEAQVRPRSGLANKFGVTVLNSPGTIDSDYRGEVGVILINLGPLPFEAKKGDRIAQLVIARAPQARLVESVDSLTETARADGGFGSTGTK